jgi:DNA invertase Pin-like site-specific DNA recombinase
MFVFVVRLYIIPGIFVKTKAKKMEFTLYTRTSTGKQQIGIEEQKQHAYRWLKDGDIIVNEYSEVESGRKNDRKQLLEALAYCKKNNTTLLITRLDRLSRSASFTMMLADSNVEFLALDCPNANKMTIGFMSLMNQDYAEKVSANTKKALAYLKSQGVILGKAENFTNETRLKGSAQTKSKYEELNKQVTKIIVRLRNEKRTFDSIAQELNADCYKTATGGEFTKQIVKRLFDRATK